MKINNISLKDFRNHQLTDINLNEKVNLFLGNNNNGKSSIKAALEMVLTGGCEFTGDKGQEYEDLIRTGTKQLVISANINGIGSIVKRFAKSKQLYLNDENVSQEVIDTEIEKQVKLGVLKAIFSSSKFIDMTVSEKKDFIFNLLDIQLNENVILSNLSTTKDNVIEKIKKDLPSEYDITVLDKLYDKYYSERRDLKRDIKSYKEKDTDFKNSGVDFSAEVYNEKVQELDSLCLILDGILKKIGVSEHLDKEKQSITESITKLTTNLENYNSELKELEKLIIISESIEELEKKLVISEEELKLNEEKRLKYQQEVNDIKTKISSLNNLIPKLQTEQCPLYSEIVCKQDKIPIINELNEELAELESGVCEYEFLIETIKNLITSISSNISELKASINYLKTKKELDEKIDICNKDLKTYQEKLSTINDTDVSLLQREQEEHNKSIKELKEYINSKKLYDANTNLLKQKESKLEVLETLVEEFSSNGIKNKILTERINVIKEKANERLSLLTGGEYSIDFDLSDGFEILVTNSSGTVKARKMSLSERLRIGIILQDIFSNLTDSKLLVIDDVDILDNNNRKFFEEFIEKIIDDYDTILIFATGDETTFSFNACNYFAVENGEVFDMFA